MSYLTWLDWYISGAREKLAQQLPGRAEKSLTSITSRSVATDREAMFLMSLAAMESYLKSIDCRIHEVPVSDSGIAAYTFHGALVAITCPKPAEFCEILSGAYLPPPSAIKLSGDLARDLSRAKAPRTEDWLPEAMRATWYFDVPHRALLVGPHQVRAIMLQPTPKQVPAVAGILILTQPGDNEIAGRFVWMLAGGTDDQLYGCADTDIDYDAVREAASDFVKLVLLYHKQIEKEPPFWLPKVRSGFTGLSRKKQKARQKTHSMFSVRELRSPVDRFGRTGTGQGGWRLEHRSKVREHFRWQPHGPKSALRRLQFIAEHYRGPEEGEKRVLMDKLY